jgi:hypothetical protein
MKNKTQCVLTRPVTNSFDGFKPSLKPSRENMGQTHQTVSQSIDLRSNLLLPLMEAKSERESICPSGSPAVFGPRTLKRRKSTHSEFGLINSLSKRPDSHSFVSLDPEIPRSPLRVQECTASDDDGRGPFKANVLSQIESPLTESYIQYDAGLPVCKKPAVSVSIPRAIRPGRSFAQEEPGADPSLRKLSLSKSSAFSSTQQIY